MANGKPHFTLEPGPVVDELIAALERSGMRRTRCQSCNCEMLTRGASDLCPPCRDKFDAQLDDEGFPF